MTAAFVITTACLSWPNATRDTDLPNILLCCVARDIHGTISARLPNLSAGCQLNVRRKKRTASAQPSSRPSGGANRRQRLLVVLDFISDALTHRSALLDDFSREGPELVSARLPGWAEQHWIDLEFTQPGKPTPKLSMWSGSTASFPRREVLNFYVFSRLSEVRTTIVDAWVQEYNEQRPHESLGNFTPEEFALNMPGAPVLLYTNCGGFALGPSIFL